MGDEPFWAKWLQPKQPTVSNFTEQETTIIKVGGYNAEMAFEAHQNAKALTTMFQTEHEAFMTAVRDIAANQQEIKQRLEVLENAD